MNKNEYILHNEAMDMAELALMERIKGNIEKARNLFSLAFEKEKAAAKSVANNFGLEPSRSVLFQSAASMAYNAEMYRDAEKMISYALLGDPPQLIADELRNLYENINFYRED